LFIDVAFVGEALIMVGGVHKFGEKRAFSGTVFGEFYANLAMSVHGRI